MSTVEKIVPCSPPRHEGPKNGARAEAFCLRPRQLLGSQLSLSSTVGQVQTNGNGHGAICFIQFDRTLNLMVYFAGVCADR